MGQMSVVSVSKNSNSRLKDQLNCSIFMDQSCILIATGALLKYKLQFSQLKNLLKILTANFYVINNFPSFIPELQFSFS